MSASAAMNAYRKVGLETKVESANPHKLISLLFEGAIGAIAKAIHQYDTNDLNGRLVSVDKANSIVIEGLMAGVDRTAKNDISTNLVDLYQYVSQLLLTSNLKNVKEPLVEAKSLLGELHEAWQDIGKAS
jgi:flagellar protein FliS